MKNLRVARRYARGLMAAAEDGKTVDRIARDLELIGQVLRDSRELRMLLASPVIAPGKKTSVFRELFERHVSPGTITFLSLLTAKNREDILPEIIEQFRVLHDELLGIITVEVTAAVELTPPQHQQLRAELERTTRKSVRVRFALDNRMRGGLVVRIGDTVLDASIRRQLELLRERLVAGGPLTN
jgi:F-type H+-transporting ATPase subunit delta